jgi:outer membrane protein assembly factor BamB
MPALIRRLTPACFIAMTALMLALTATPVSAADWGMFGGSPSHDRVSQTFPGRVLEERWAAGFDSVAGYQDHECAVVRNGRVFAIGTPVDLLTEQRLYAVDAATGTVLWSTPAFSTDRRSSCPAVDADRVYVSEGTTVKAYAVTDGAEQWSQVASTAYDAVGLTSPTVADGSVYVGSFGNGGVAALDAASGAVRWHQLAGRVFDAPMVVGDNVLFAAGQNSDIVDYAATDGTLRWSAGCCDHLYADAAVFGSTVYLADNVTRTVSARDATTGTQLWARQLPTGIYPRSLVVDDQRVFVVGLCTSFCGVAPSQMLALDRADGTTRWSTAATFPDDGRVTGDGGGDIWGTAAVLGGVFVASGEAVAVDNGDHVSPLVNWPYNDVTSVYDEPAYADGIIYAWKRTDSTKRLVALGADVTPPETTMTDRGYGRYELGSSEAGSTFECQLDDGAWTGCTSPAQVSYASVAPGPHTLRARAIDRAGNVDASPASATFDVPVPVTPPPGTGGDGGSPLTPTPPAGLPGVSINAGARYTNDPDVLVRVVWPAGTTTLLISNDGGFAAPRQLPVAANIPWRLDASGPERLPKTIYVRFGSSSQTFQDDIILDQTAPVISGASIAGTASRASAASVKSYTIRVKAKDNLSGVAQLQITNSKRKPGSWRRFAASVRFRATSRRVFVRVRDKAGNASAWRMTR